MVSNAPTPFSPPVGGCVQHTYVPPFHFPCFFSSNQSLTVVSYLHLSSNINKSKWWLADIFFLFVFFPSGNRVPAANVAEDVREDYEQQWWSCCRQVSFFLIVFLFSFFSHLDSIETFADTPVLSLSIYLSRCFAPIR